jgi:hypothetical protein
MSLLAPFDRIHSDTAVVIASCHFKGSTVRPEYHYQPDDGPPIYIGA